MKKNRDGLRIVTDGPEQLDEREALFERWRNDRDALPLARYLLEQEDMHGVSVLCQIAIEEEEDSERRTELEQLFSQTGRPPSTWDDALVEFAEDPSFEAWEDLFQWVPVDSYYHRSKTSIRRLRQLGVDPDILFQCATHWGTSSDAIELADTGAASPDAIMERGEGAVTEGFYVALAAHSAAARGDQPRAVWLGNRALSMGRDQLVRSLIEGQLMQVLELLDDDHRAMLSFEPPF